MRPGVPVPAASLRLLVLGAEPGDGRALRFCLGLPPHWSTILFSPRPGPDLPTPPIRHRPGLEEQRGGVEAPGATAAARLGALGVQGDTAVLGLSLAAGRNAGLREHLRRLAADVDLVAHLSPWSADICRDHGTPEIYLPAGFVLGAATEGLNGPGLEDAWAMLWSQEAALAQRAALVLPPGAQEAQVFRLLYGVPPARMEEADDAPPLERMVAIAAGARAPGHTPQARAPVTLALNDYPLHDPRNGGALRSQSILQGLERDVLAVTLGPRPAFVALGPRLLEVVLPWSAAQRRLGRSLHRIAAAPLDDLLAAAHVAGMPLLGTLLARLGPRLDAIVFEHPYMAPLLPALRRAAGNVPVILHAHNVEGALKADLLADHPLAALATGFTAQMEHDLAADAGLVICCSEPDADHFRGQGAPVLVVPHDAAMAGPPGVFRPQPGGPARIGFLASAHAPNRAAARFIAEELAPAFPEATFEIVGSVCETLPLPLPGNLVLHGVLPPERMHAVLSGWLAALNPVEAGGGSSVKLAQYLAVGLPTISTPHAARGFAIEGSGAGLVVPLAGFTASLRQLLAEPALRDALARAAGAYWSRPERLHPLHAARDAVAALAAPHATPRPPRRLLVVADAATPAQASLLDATVEGLRAGFGEIDALRTAAAGGGISSAPPDWPDELPHPAGTPLGAEAGHNVPPSPEALAILVREAEAILADFAPLLPLDTPAMPWTGFFPAEPGLAGRTGAARFTLLLPSRAAWAQLRLATPRDLVVRLSLSVPCGPASDAARLGILRSRRLPAGQGLLDLDLPPRATARPTLLLAELMEPGTMADATGVRLLQFACGRVGGLPPEVADLRHDAMDAFRAAFPDRWRGTAARAAERRNGSHRTALRPAQATARAAAGTAARYDAVLLAADMPGAAAPAPGTPILALDLSSPGPFGTLPEPTLPETSPAEGTPQAPGHLPGPAALRAFPGLWPGRPAMAATLHRMRAIQEEAPSRRGAIARAALALQRPYLLAASLDGPLPRPAEALHALTAPLDLDLVLAGEGWARRIAPDGEARTAVLPLADLLGGQAPECLGLWLPETWEDERALVALAWLVGVPVLAAAANWHARHAVQQSVSGLLLRDSPPWNGLDALLRQPALRAALVRGGAEALRDWLRAEAEWPS